MFLYFDFTWFIISLTSLTEVASLMSLGFEMIICTSFDISVLSTEEFILLVDSLKAWSDSLAFEIVGLLKSLPLRVAGSELSRFGYLNLDMPGMSFTDWKAVGGCMTERLWDSFDF